MGPRVCIGKRFGYTEVHAIAAGAAAAAFGSSCRPATSSTIHQAPTLSPAGGLPVRLTAR